MSTLPMDEKRREAILQALIVWDESCSGRPDAFEQALRAAGYVVAPVEPSEAMADKGESALICGPLPSDLDTSPSATWAAAKTCYRAMIAASSDGKVVAG